MSSYLDKEEETWLKGNESQRAWAAVNAQEQAEQERLNAVYAARWAGIASMAQAKKDIDYRNSAGLMCTVESPYGINSLEWLTDIYKTDDLPGSTALERTQYLLDLTRNNYHTHFNETIPQGDYGFDPIFRDSSVWPASSRQVGHFLTAVDLSLWQNGVNTSSRILPWSEYIPLGLRKQFALSAIIGHELIGDQYGPYIQTYVGFTYNLQTLGAVQRWFLSGEDGNFQKIMNMGPQVLFIKIPSKADGNSIQDLRLSYQGWIAGEELKNGNVETPEDFAQWLETHLK